MLTTLLGFLGAVWLKVLRPAMQFIDKHDDVVQSIETIENEITCNGGGSLKDSVIRLNDTCGRIENRQKIIEQRTKASLHYSNTALFETDKKGRLVWTNEPFYLMTGQTLTDIKGYDWITYIHEEDREEFLQEFKSCLEMNRKFSKELTTSDGQEMRMVGYPYRLNDNEQGGFLISLSEAQKESIIMGSKKWSLNWVDGKKLGLNTLFVSLAAGLTYLGTQVGNVDWGSATALVVPIAALLLGTATQWAKDNSEKE